MIRAAVLADRVAAVQASTIEPVAGDLDVFGDGTVQMISTPGHTPGHHALMLKLAHTGVVLSGDVAHLQVNYDRDLVPGGNFSRAETIASSGRLHGLAVHFHARIVIQHPSDVFDKLPRLPASAERPATHQCDVKCKAGAESSCNQAIASIHKKRHINIQRNDNEYPTLHDRSSIRLVGIVFRHGATTGTGARRQADVGRVQGCQKANLG